ncbi:unnamed protein product [Amoebophrya sp. A25]|nr:unnamed protein product [Amoebophrya sp. A25]|eukprot:GSA25T00021558001.1
MGSHGAGLAWMAFMSKDHSAVIEILPQQPVVSVQGLCQRQNFWDKNRLAIYGGLARIAGVRHYCQHSFFPAKAATNAKRGAEGEAGSSSEYSLAEITANFGLVRKGKVKLDPGAIAKAVKTSPIIM